MSRAKNTNINRGRLIVLVGVVSLFWLALEINLFRLQVLDNELFTNVAERQYLKRIPLHASRGAIIDRHGNKLATNTIHYDLAADPSLVTQKKYIAQKCATAFKRPQSYYAKKLNRESRFEYLARKVSDADIRDIINLKDPGIIKTENFRRNYPYQQYGGHLLGFTDPDDNGLSGLELQFEEALKGKDGEAVLQYDGPRRRVFFNADNPILRPQDGKNIVLTIDKNIQTVVEQELQKGVEKVKGLSGMAVVLDPNNGAVLALANFPSFNPNRQQNYKSWTKKNRTITDVFEPGSTLKIFTAAALLQEQLVSKDSIVYCEQGRYRLYNKYFSDTKKHGWLTFQKVIEKSSNIGTIKLSAELKSNTFFRYLRNFGFGSPSEIGLIGEANGMLENPQKWSGLSKASISIGYEIGVTAVQLANAYAAAVNGGYLYRPFVVDHLEDTAGNVFNRTEPLQIRQIISEEVSDELKSYMRGVVQEGTGKKAKVNGLVVGGKTGTAKKMNHKTGTYYRSKYVGSFAGFAPFNNPKYVCVVIVDEPKTKKYGGDVAAPVFSRIINRIINFESIDDWETGDDQSYEQVLAEADHDLPPVQGFQAENAYALLEMKGIDYEVRGQGQRVKKVSKDDDEVILELGNSSLKSEKVPKLVGLTLREAMSRVNLSRYKIKLEGGGSGIVRKQRPAPGTIARNRTQLTLTCR